MEIKNELGFELHFSASNNLNKFNESVQIHFQWLDEILEVAKKTFNHSDEQLLPKTPCMKRGRRLRRLSRSKDKDDPQVSDKNSSRNLMKNNRSVRRSLIAEMENCEKIINLTISDNEQTELRHSSRLKNKCFSKSVSTVKENKRTTRQNSKLKLQHDNTLEQKDKENNVTNNAIPIQKNECEKMLQEVSMDNFKKSNVSKSTPPVPIIKHPGNVMNTKKSTPCNAVSVLLTPIKLSPKTVKTKPIFNKVEKLGVKKKVDAFEGIISHNSPGENGSPNGAKKNINVIEPLVVDTPENLIKITPVRSVDYVSKATIILSSEKSSNNLITTVKTPILDNIFTSKVVLVPCDSNSKVPPKKNSCTAKKNSSIERLYSLQDKKLIATMSPEPTNINRSQKRTSVQCKALLKSARQSLRQSVRLLTRKSTCENTTKQILQEELKAISELNLVSSVKKKSAVDVSMKRSLRSTANLRSSKVVLDGGKKSESDHSPRRTRAFTKNGKKSLAEVTKSSPTRTSIRVIKKINDIKNEETDNSSSADDAMRNDTRKRKSDELGNGDNCLAKKKKPKINVNRSDKSLSPVCPENKIVRPLNKKRKFDVTLEVGPAQKVAAYSTGKKNISKIFTKSLNVSVEKISWPKSNHSFLNSFSSKKNHLNSSLNRSGYLSSFIIRNSPHIINNKEKEEMLKEIQKKVEKEDEILRKRQEFLRERVEEQKRKREERIRKVQEQREIKDRFERELKEKIVKKLESEQTFSEKLRSDKIKEEKLKMKLRLKKQQEAEKRRRHEEELRLQKIQESKEDDRRHQELLQRKKEFEEQERQRKLMEQKRLEDEKKLEKERERALEYQKLKEAELEQQREYEKMKEEKERQRELERIAREKCELERIQEKDRLRQEAIEREKDAERQLLKEKREQDKNRAEYEKKENELKAMINKHNTNVQPMKGNTSTTIPLIKPIQKNELNTTQTLLKDILNTSHKKEENSDSYEMTPKRIPKPSTLTNYDISDLKSDDSTDDEKAPRKKIPQWAQGAALTEALIRQAHNPPDLTLIFTVIETPDLCKLFKIQRKRFNKRTSSATWDSPILNSD